MAVHTPGHRAREYVGVSLAARAAWRLASFREPEATPAIEPFSIEFLGDRLREAVALGELTPAAVANLWDHGQLALAEELWRGPRAGLFRERPWADQSERPARPVRPGRGRATAMAAGPSRGADVPLSWFGLARGHSSVDAAGRGQALELASGRENSPRELKRLCLEACSAVRRARDEWRDRTGLAARGLALGEPRTDEATVAVRDAWLEASHEAAAAARDRIMPIDADLDGGVLTGGATGLAMVLRAVPFDGLFPEVSRLRRAAEGIAALGFDRELSDRVRVESSRSGEGLGVAIAYTDLPVDVRMATSRRAPGLLGELAALHGLGRGLACALVHPAMPIEHRVPAAGTVAGAMGVLFAQLLGDPVFLRRVADMNRRTADLVQTRAALALTLAGRWLAAAVRAGARAEAEEVEGTWDAARELLATAVGIEPAPGTELLLLTALPSIEDQLRAFIGGLALAVAMRDAFDEDWFRNPRAAEPLRAAAARGGELTVEAFLAELGHGAGVASARQGELVGL